MTYRSHARALAAAALLAALAQPVLAQPANTQTAVDDATADGSSHAYTTVRGDTLIGIGRRLLADAAQWRQLAQVNGLKNPNRIDTGTVLRIPLVLLRQQPVPAVVVSVVGDVRGSTGPLAASTPVAEGGTVSTGPDGHVTIRLVDGTLLRLRPDSELRLSESRRLPDIDGLRSRARLGKGRVEVEATTARDGKPGFKIDTPQGVLGVRGTEFRVATGGPDSITYGEVLQGVVAFSGAGTAATAVPAGFGNLIGPAGDVATPVPLLPAPTVNALPVLQERPLLRFALPPLVGAAAYRGQIAVDPQYDRVLADLTSATPELRFAGLPDGSYRLRMRAIDSRGLEGRDAEIRFTLKARPEPPLPTAPAPRTVLYGTQVNFGWAASEQAQRYRLRLATDPAFAAPVRELSDLQGSSASVDDLPPGNYLWQLRSVRDTQTGPDLGPWGDVQRFELRPTPPTPTAPAAKVSDSGGVGFAWEAAPGQQFDFELARDAAFGQPVLQRRLTEPAIELAAPGTGRFHVRLRAIDADGFVGPWSAARFFDIPNCVRDGQARCVRWADGTLDLVP